MCNCRTGALGLVPEDVDEDEDNEKDVIVVTKIEDIQKGVVYQMAYCADEADGYDAMDEEYDQGEAQPEAMEK